LTDETEEKEEDTSFNRWGWVATIFELCENDLTKIDLVTERNIIEVLNWLSYHKEKTELINKKQNNYR